jgi:uncharacterized protein
MEWRFNMFTLSPKEDKFYDYFISYAHIIYRSAEKLKAFMDDMNDPEAQFMEIKEIEHEGDNQVHLILRALNQTFLTPIDREDIHTIAKQMDDIIDYMETTVSRFAMFNIKAASPEAKKIGDLIFDCAKQMISLMEELKIARKSKKLSQVIIEINRIEEQGDAAFRVAVKDLFASGMSTLEVIMWKEIYDYLEKTLNAYEDVANTVEGVVMKHA